MKKGCKKVFRKCNDNSLCKLMGIKKCIYDYSEDKKYTPLLTNLSISGIRVFWEKIFLWLKESTRISKMLGSLVGFSKVFHSCHFLINQSYYVDTLWLYLFTIMLVTDLLRFRSYNLSVKFLLSDFQINLC